MRSLIRFGLSGILATLAHASVFVLLIEWANVRPFYAAAPAFLAAVGLSYGLNYRWTFQAAGPHRILLPRFILVALAALGLNLLVTYVIVDWWRFWYGYALLIIVTLIPLVTFFLSKFWVFQNGFTRNQGQQN